MSFSGGDALVLLQSIVNTKALCYPGMRDFWG